MDDTHEEARRVLAKLRSTESEPRTAAPATRLTERHVGELWKRLGAMFGGARMEQTIGVADDGTWLAGLQDLTPAQVGRGLRTLLDSSATWPPSLPEFRAMCQGKGRTYLGSDAAPMLADLREWKRTDAGRQGLAEALAVVRRR